MAYLFAYVPSTSEGLTVIAPEPDPAMCPDCPPDCAWPGIAEYGDGTMLCLEHYHARNQAILSRLIDSWEKAHPAA